jgi:cytochrome c556
MFLGLFQQEGSFMKLFSASAAAILTIAGGLGVASLPGNAHSEGRAHGGEMTPHEVRDEVMHAIGSHMKALGDIAKGEAEMDASTIVHAKSLQALSATIVYLFPEGSASDVDTDRTKPEIWERWDEFAAVSAAFAAATPKAVAAVESGERGEIGMALREIGKTCGDCHKPFREEKD